MAASLVTIDGKPCALFGAMHTAQGAIEPAAGLSWALSWGVDPCMVDWHLEPDLAAYVLSKTEVSIHMEGVGSDPLDAKRVQVIGEMPSPSSRRRVVRFADLRFWLQYTNPLLAFNVRARTGSVNYEGNARQLLNIPTFVYRLYSVNKDGTPVQAAALLKAMLDATAGPGNWVLDAPPRATNIPNDIDLVERGDVSLLRTMATIGGMDCYVDPRDGLIHVAPRLPGDERMSIAKLGELEGHSKIVWDDKSHVRPASFDVMFQPQMEFRTDYVETGGTVSRPDKLLPYSQCVVEVMEDSPGHYMAPDPITGVTRHANPGEFIDVSAYVATMPLGPKVTSMDFTRLQRSFNNPNLLQELGSGVITPDPGETQRIKSLLSSYRHRFRLNPAWASLCVPGSIDSVMVGTADAETGDRVPSDVFVDHCVVPTVQVAITTTNATSGWNQDSFPPFGAAVDGEKAYPDQGGSVPTPITTLKSAPFDCNIEDADTGLYSITPRPDFADERDEVIPSRILNMPVQDWTQNNQALNLFFWDQAPVTAGHRMSVILSAQPAGTNDKATQWHEAVTIAEAASRLGTTVPAGTGRTKELRVGPGDKGSLCARFAWVDSLATVIYSCFTGQKINDASPFSFLTPSNETVVRDYALSVCAAVLANYLPRSVGTQSIGFDPSWLPIGSLRRVTHAFGADGGYFTVLDCEDMPGGFVADHFLSADALRAIRRRVTT